MIKLLIDNPQGIQEIIEVDDGGGYFDSSRIIYDERIHGPMDEFAIRAHLGSWSRDGQKRFVHDPAKKVTHDNAVDIFTSSQASQETKRSNRKNILKAVRSANTLAEVKTVLIAIVEHLGLDQ